LNPFEDINPSPNGDMIIDKAFRRAAKHRYQPTKKADKLRAAKIDARNKIIVFSQVLTDTLTSIVERFPTIENIEVFYYNLLDVLFGVDNIRKALSKINGVIPIIKKIVNSNIRKIGRCKSRGEVEKNKKSVYGRCASLINKISSDLQFIRDVIFEIRKLPSVDFNLITIAVAGHPNVGKSTFVKAISTAEPEIADYPFTTKKIFIGHWIYEGEKIQLIDTPGLLDRPINKKNKIELQALIVLKNIADVIIFLFDPSETSGYQIENQLILFRQIKELFSDVIIFPIINKIDVSPKIKVDKIIEEVGDIPKISANNKKQVKEIMDMVIKKIKLKLQE